MGTVRKQPLTSMKAFIVLPALLAYCNGAAQVLVRGAGQTSHQSVSKPFQGELRSTVQRKAFGAGNASVSDSPNRLHGARGVIVHPVSHGIAHPVAHAVAPFGVAHAAPLVHAAPVVHAAAGYAAPDLADVSPYSYNYAVADDYSGAAFNQAESNDGTGIVEGSYSVNLPDGRIQTVNYKANDLEGYVADVTYEGEAQYPEAVPVAHAVAHPVAHAIAHPVAHAVAAPVLAHPVAHAVAPAVAVARPLIG